MQSLLDFRDEIGGRLPFGEAFYEHLLTSLALVLAIFLTRTLARRVTLRRIDDVKRLYYARKAIDYVTFGTLILALGYVWFGRGLENLGTFLGLVSAGVAIALGDLLVNLAGWLFIMTRRPFEVGDRIELGEHKGDVIDIRLFQTYLLECGNWVHADQSTGRIVMVPNSAIFRQPTASYTRSFEHIWDEIEVLVTFESDWKRAKEVLLEIARTHAEPLSEGAQQQIQAAARKHMIFFRKLTPIVYTAVDASGVRLTIRYLTQPRARRGNAERIWEAILEAFETEPRLELAYPTTRFYDGARESKQDLRSPEGDVDDAPRPEPGTTV